MPSEGRSIRAFSWLAALALVAGLAFGGCAGGQSGAEDFCGESNRDMNTFTTDAADEDGGVEDDADAGDGGPTELVADGPEANNAPILCAPPDEGAEY